MCFGAKEDNVDYGQSLQVPNGNYVGLDSGLYHNCAITPDSEVHCWGAGKTIGVEPHYGQSLVPLLADVVKVSTGGYHSCALTVDQDVTCWGALQVLAPTWTLC